MNYAYSYNFNGSIENIHFSNGKYNKVLNPMRLCESEGLGTRDRLTFLESERSCFAYKVDENGGVDWNRDGVISSCNNDPECLNPDNCVSAYINYCADSPDALRFRQNTNWSNGEKTEYTPKLVIFNNELYIFYVKLDDGKLYYSKFIRFEGCDSDGKNPCDIWSQPQTIPVNHTPLSSPSAAEISIGAEKRLYIVYISDGNIYSRYMNDRGIWSSEDVVVAHNAKLDPELRFYRNNLMLVFVGAGNKLFYKLMNEDGEWGIEESIRDEYGRELYSFIPPSVAVKPYFVIRWPFIYDLSIAHIIYSTDNSKYELTMRYFDQDNNIWYKGANFGGGDINESIWESTQRSNKKVGFEWVNDIGVVGKNGRFYLMFKNLSLDRDGNLIDDMVVKYGFMMPDNDGRWKWIKIGNQDNEFTYSITGVSLVTFNGNGLTGLSAAYGQYDRDKNIIKPIRFIPYANGIYDYELRDSDDWYILSNGFCISIRRVFGDDLAYCGGMRNRLIMLNEYEY